MKLSKQDLTMSCLLCLIIGLFLGYFWRFFQESPSYYCGSMEDIIHLAEQNSKTTYHFGEYRIYALKNGKVVIEKHK